MAKAQFHRKSNIETTVIILRGFLIDVGRDGNFITLDSSFAGILPMQDLSDIDLSPFSYTKEKKTKEKKKDKGT